MSFEARTSVTHFQSPIDRVNWWNLSARTPRRRGPGFQSPIDRVNWWNSHAEQPPGHDPVPFSPLLIGSIGGTLHQAPHGDLVGGLSVPY